MLSTLFALLALASTGLAQNGVVVTTVTNVICYTTTSLSTLTINGLSSTAPSPLQSIQTVTVIPAPVTITATITADPITVTRISTASGESSPTSRTASPTLVFSTITLDPADPGTRSISSSSNTPAYSTTGAFSSSVIPPYPSNGTSSRAPTGSGASGTAPFSTGFSTVITSAPYPTIPLNTSLLGTGTSPLPTFIPTNSSPATAPYPTLSLNTTISSSSTAPVITILPTNTSSSTAPYPTLTLNTTSSGTGTAPLTTMLPTNSSTSSAPYPTLTQNATSSGTGTAPLTTILPTNSSSSSAPYPTLTLNTTSSGTGTAPLTTILPTNSSSSSAPYPTLSPNTTMSGTGTAPLTTALPTNSSSSTAPYPTVSNSTMTGPTGTGAASTPTPTLPSGPFFLQASSTSGTCNFKNATYATPDGNAGPSTNSIGFTFGAATQAVSSRFYIDTAGALHNLMTSGTNTVDRIGYIDVADTGDYQIYFGLSTSALPGARTTPTCAVDPSTRALTCKTSTGAAGIFYACSTFWRFNTASTCSSGCTFALTAVFP